MKMTSSIPFNLELKSKNGTTYNVSLTSSMNNNFHLTLDDDCKKSQSKFVVDDLPVFLVTKTGFYLGVRYNIKMINPSTGLLSYFQKTGEGTYIPVATPGTNILAFTIFKPNAIWKEDLELVRKDNLNNEPDIALFNFSIKDCPTIIYVSFHKYENPTTGLLTYSAVQCFDQMPCSSCGNPACPLGSICASAVCTSMGVVDFTLRIAQNSREYILVYDFSKCGKKIMFSSIPIEQVSGSVDDPFNYKFRVLQSDTAFIENQRSILYIVNANTKYYLSNPKILHKSNMTEYTLTTNSQEKHLLAVNSNKTGLWRTYVFDTCDFENLVVPPVDQYYCNEKGGVGPDSTDDDSSSATGHYFEESSTSECKKPHDDSTISTNDLEKVSDDHKESDECDCHHKTKDDCSKSETPCRRRTKTPIGFWGDISLKNDMVINNSQTPPPAAPMPASVIQAVAQANAQGSVMASRAQSTPQPSPQPQPPPPQPSTSWLWWVIGGIGLLIVIIIIIIALVWWGTQPSIKVKSSQCAVAMKPQQVVEKQLRPVTTMQTETRQIEVQVPTTHLEEVDVISTKMMPVEMPVLTSGRQTKTVETQVTTQRAVPAPRTQSIQLRRVS